MTEYNAAPAAVLGRAAEEVETVAEMTTGWRLAARIRRRADGRVEPVAP